MEQDFSFIEVVPPSGDELNKHSHGDHTAASPNANTTLNEARERKKRKNKMFPSGHRPPYTTILYAYKEVGLEEMKK
eukprot:2399843-Ditylum_brightwellii.AAC.1